MEEGFSPNDIDQWDIFFFFDILSYKERKNNLKTIAMYDSMGY